MQCKDCFYAITHGRDNCPALVPTLKNRDRNEEKRRQLVCEETRQNDRNERSAKRELRFNR